MLVLGSVAVAASAEMLTEKAGTVLTYTASVKGKTANADGAIEVEPGEKFIHRLTTISVRLVVSSLLGLTLSSVHLQQLIGISTTTLTTTHPTRSTP